MKLIIAEWSYQGDIGQGESSLLSRGTIRTGESFTGCGKKDGFGRNEWKAYLRALKANDSAGFR
jgi:hypothetical protein